MQRGTDLARLHDELGDLAHAGAELDALLFSRSRGGKQREGEGRRQGISKHVCHWRTSSHGKAEITGEESAERAEVAA